MCMRERERLYYVCAKKKNNMINSILGNLGDYFSKRGKFSGKQRLFQSLKT